MNMTVHAKERSQQRGIEPMALHLLQQYGKELHDHRGARIMYFDKNSWKEMQRSEGKRAIRNLSEMLGIYAVFALEDDRVITVGHNFKRKKTFH